MAYNKVGAVGARAGKSVIFRGKIHSATANGSGSWQKSVSFFLREQKSASHRYSELSQIS